LGFGEVGAELARRLRGLGCTVFYNRRHRLPPHAETGLGVAYMERDALLATSDYLVNLLPYFPETDHALGAAEFAQMKSGACLASCGSGSVIDEVALAEALRAGRLGGAALDTYEWEPLQADNPLRVLAVENPAANILLTPHVAAGAPPAGTIPGRAAEYTPIMQFLRGEPLPYRVA
jgi:phosphoglycerate dehydrogenase-like enzyme